jgi:hypothetical protein
MAENRFSCGGVGGRDTVCIDTNRVLDSCRDRDCFENVRVYLSDFGNEILEHTSAIRTKHAKIVSSYIGVDPIQFNSGFYAVTIRFYVKVCVEACLGGGRSQELEGVAVVEKRVILYGGESGVNVFKSHACTDFCACPTPNCGEGNDPTAIVEVVDPVVLTTRIMETPTECNCCCCCCEGDLPQPVVTSLDSPLCFDDNSCRRFLTVSLGIFSIVRIVRPAQLLVAATDFCIPEKECKTAQEDDPCCVFRSMPFPVNEFCPTSAPLPAQGGDRPCRCGS